MIQPDELALAVDEHPDGIEPHVAGVGPVGDLEQEGARHPAHLLALAFVQRLPRSTAREAGPPRLDLDEHERGPVEDHQVDLTVTRAVVARDGRVPEALQMREREILAEASEVLSQVGGHVGRRYGARRAM